MKKIPTLNLGLNELPQKHTHTSTAIDDNRIRIIHNLENIGNNLDLVEAIDMLKENPKMYNRLFFECDKHFFESIDINHLANILKSLYTSQYFYLYEQYNIQTIYNLLKFDEVDTIFQYLDTIINNMYGQRRIRSDQFLSFLFWRPPSDNIKDFQEKVADLLIVLKYPETQLDEFIRIQVQNMAQDSSFEIQNTLYHQFDRRSFSRALMTDREMALLNVWLFFEDTLVERDDFDSWGDFLIAVADSRHEKYKNTLLQNIQNMTNLSLEDIQQKVVQIESDTQFRHNTDTIELKSILKHGHMKSAWERENPELLKWRTSQDCDLIRSSIPLSISRDQQESTIGIATNRSWKPHPHAIFFGFITPNIGKNYTDHQHYMQGDFDTDIFLVANTQKLKNRSVYNLYRDYVPPAEIYTPNLYGITSIKGSQSTLTNFEWACYMKLLENTKDYSQSSSFDMLEVIPQDGVTLDDIESICFRKQEDFEYFIQKYPQYSDKYKRVKK